jgi:hypothetical protein
LKVCTLMRSVYCTSIIAPRRRRDASDNIERMAIACCSPRTTGHGQGLARAAMNSRGERYPRALCG